MAQRMPVKRRAKNGATRSTMWCCGSNRAMNASGWPGTSRKRTNAFILCVSRRTAWARAVARRTSASAGLLSTDRSPWAMRHSRRYSKARRWGSRWHRQVAASSGSHVERWVLRHRQVSALAARPAHPAARCRSLPASPVEAAPRRAATLRAQHRARPAATTADPPAATSAARQAADGASNSEPWRGGGASCARSAAGSSSALRG